MSEKSGDMCTLKNGMAEHSEIDEEVDANVLTSGDGPAQSPKISKEVSENSNDEQIADAISQPRIFQAVGSFLIDLHCLDESLPVVAEGLRDKTVAALKSLEAFTDKKSCLVDKENSNDSEEKEIRG